MVLKNPDGGSNWVRGGVDSDFGYTGGSYMSSTNAGGTWTPGTEGYDHLFIMYGEAAAPEGGGGGPLATDISMFESWGF
jgi:hypothetical protein